MKKLFRKLQNAMSRMVAKIRRVVNTFLGFSRRALCGNAGEGYIDTAVKILIAVVLGALLLAGLYALFGDVVMPTLVERIEEMFDYGPR